MDFETSKMTEIVQKASQNKENDDANGEKLTTRVRAYNFLKPTF